MTAMSLKNLNLYNWTDQFDNPSIYGHYYCPLNLILISYLVISTGPIILRTLSSMDSLIGLLSLNISPSLSNIIGLPNLIVPHYSGDPIVLLIFIFKQNPINFIA